MIASRRRLKINKTNTIAPAAEAEEIIEGEAVEEEMKEEAPSTEELESEEAVTDADLAVPLEAAEEMGLVDDPVRMYLHEIGRVPLLKADDEKHLAKQIELGKRITEIRNACREELGREPRTGEIIHYMLRETCQADVLMRALQKALNIEPETSFKKDLFNEKLRRAMDNEISPELTAALAVSLGCSAPEAGQAIIDLSLNCQLLPEEVWEGAMGKGQAEELKRLTDAPAFAAATKKIREQDPAPFRGDSKRGRKGAEAFDRSQPAPGGERGEKAYRPRHAAAGPDAGRQPGAYSRRTEVRLSPGI